MPICMIESFFNMNKKILSIFAAGFIFLSTNLPLASAFIGNPTVSIEKPLDGAVVSKYATIQVLAKASDPLYGIAQIRIYLDGTQVKTCYKATTCSIWWTPKQGYHTVRVDASNNSSDPNVAIAESTIYKQ